MAYNYTIKFNGDISNIESLLSKKLSKEIQKVEENKITFTFDYQNGIDSLQDKLNEIAKYLDPTIGVQFKYEVNKKLLEEVKTDLQNEINDGFGDSKNAEHLKKVIEEITSKMKELQSLGANPDYVSNISSEAQKAQETIEALEKSINDLNEKLSQSVSIEEFDELKKQIDEANQKINELINENSELQNALKSKGDYHFSYYSDFVEAQQQAEVLRSEVERLNEELLMASSGGGGGSGDGKGTLGFNMSAINRIVAAVERISDAIGEMPEEGKNLLQFLEEVNNSLKEVYANVQEISLVGTNVHIDMGDTQSIETKQYLRKQFQIYKESYEKFFSGKFINPTNVFSAIANDKKYGEIFGYDVENVKSRYGIDEITSLKDTEAQVKRIIEFFNTIDAVIKARKKTSGYDKNFEFNKELNLANSRARRVVKNRDISVIDEEMKQIENNVGQDILARLNGEDTETELKNDAKSLDDIIDKLEEIRSILERITSQDSLGQVFDNVINKLEEFKKALTTINYDKVSPITDEQGNVQKWYRGVNGVKSGFLSNADDGQTYWTTNIELAQKYADEVGKVYEAELKAKNVLEIDAEGKGSDEIEFIGTQEGKDASETLIGKRNALSKYKEELNELYAQLKEIPLIDIMGQANKGNEIEAKKRQIKDLENEIDILDAQVESSIILGTHDISSWAENNGYDGVIFNNVKTAVDDIEKLGSTMVVFSADQEEALKTITNSSETNEEKDKIESISKELEEVINTIKSKTEQFELEKQVVNNVVDEERDKLYLLITTLSEVQAMVESVYRTFDDFSNIKVDSIQTFFEELKKSIDNIDFGNGFLDQIKQILSKGDELKNLAKSLETMSKDKGATKTVKKATKTTDKTDDEKKKIKEVRDAYKTLISIEEKYQQLKNKDERSGLSKSEIYTFTKISEQREKAKNLIASTTKEIIKEVGLEEKYLDIVNQVTKAIEKQNEAEDKEATDKLKDSLQSMIDKVEKLSINPKFIESFRNELSDAAVKAQSALSGTDDEIIEMTEHLDKLSSNIPKEKLESSFTKLEKLGLDVASVLNNNTAMSAQLRKEFELLAAEIQDALDTGHWKDAGGLQKFQQRLINLQKIMKRTGQDGDAMWRRIGNRLADMNSKMIAQYLSWQDIIRYIRQISSEVIKLDTALTELRKVSDASSERLQQSLQKSTDTAKELGSTIEDVINITADWARLGYNVDEAEELARVTTLFKNVGDNMSAEDASSFMISTLKGFEMEADQAMDIADKFNEVANNFAIDTAGIGDALQRSAAAFNAANTDLNESIALITATNAVVQNPESVGTMWKTVSARIRGAKAELEDMGEDTEDMVESTSKLRDLVKGFTGFDIMEDEKTFKSIYDIIVGIGEKWNELNDIDRAALLEALAGKRAGNALAAALNNIDDLKASYETALNASGSAMKEQANYEQSIQFSIDRLKATAQDLAQDFLSSDLIKNTVDFLNTVLELLDAIVEKTGSLTPFITAIGGVFAASKFSNGMSSLAGLFSAFNTKGIISGIGGLKKSIINTFRQVGEEGGAALASSASTAATKGLHLLSNGIFTALAGATIYTIYKLATAEEDFNKRIKETSEKYKETSDSINDYKNKIIELRSITDDNTKSIEEQQSAREELLGIQSQMIDQFGKEAGQVDVLRDGIDRLTNSFHNLSESEYQKFINEFNDNSWDSEKSFGDNVANLLRDADHANGDNNIKDLIESYENYADSFNDFSNLSEEAIAELSNKLQNTEIFNGSDKQGVLFGGGHDVLNIKGNAETVYKTLVDIQKDYIGKEDELSQSINNALEKSINDVKHVVDSKKQFYNTIYEHDVLKNLYAQDIDKLEQAKQDLIEAQTSNDEVAIENATRILYEAYNVTLKRIADDPSAINWFEDSIKEYQSLLYDYDFKIKVSVDDDNTELSKTYNKIKEYLSYTDTDANELQSLAEYYNIDKIKDINKREAVKLIKELVKNGYSLSTIIDQLISDKSVMTFAEKQLREKFGDLISDLSQEDIELAITLKPEEYEKELENELKKFSEGGNVDLTLRPTIDASELNKYGWDAGEGIATTFTSTYSNEDNTVAINFTPIIVDENGNMIGVMTPEELQEYAEGVIAGTNTDYLNLQIGAKFEGNDAVNEAENAAEIIHLLQEKFYLDDDVSKSWMQLKMAIHDVFEEVNKQTQAEAIDSIDTLSKGLTKLSEIYVDVSNGKDFDFSNLTSDNLEEFKNLDSYEEFLKVISEYPDNIKKCQEAFNELASEYISTEGALSDVTEETKGLTIAYLEQLGISNAKEVVEKQIVKNSENIAIAEKFLLNTTKDLSEATADEIAEFIKEEEYSDSAAQSIYLFALKKRFAKGIDIYNANDLNYLYQMAERAGIATDKLIAFANAKAKLATAIAAVDADTALVNEANEKYKGGAITFVNNQEKLKAKEKAASELQAIVDDLQAEVNKGLEVDVPIKFDGGKTAKDAADKAGSAAKDAAEQFDWLEIKIQRCEEEIQRLDKTVSATYKNWSSRNNAIGSEIDKLREKIALQAQAYEIYMAKANSIPLADAYKQLVMNGGLNIEEIADENLKKLINDFKTWYEKAIAAKDAIDDLNSSIANLAKQKFDNVKSEFEGFTSEIEHFVKMIDRELSHVETMGKIAGKSFYQEKIDKNEEELEKLKEEREALVDALEEAEANGIEKGSADWIAMRNDIYAVDEEIQNLTYDIEELKQKIIQVDVLKFDNLKEQFDGVLSGIQHFRNMVDKMITHVENMGGIAGKSFYQAEIDQNNERLDALKVERQKLMKQLKEAEEDGLEKGSPDWLKMRDAIYEIDEQIVDTKYETEELKKKMKEVAMLDFDDLKAQFEQITSIIQNQVDVTNSVISLIDKSGHIASTKYYKNLIKMNKQTISTLRKEYETLQKKLAKAMENGDVKKYSDEWYKMTDSIDEVKKKILETAEATVEYANAIRQIKWDMFDRGLSDATKLAEEQDFLAEQLREKAFDKDTGKITDSGMAAQALYVSNYEIYKKEAHGYAKEIEKIKKELEADPKNVTLIDRYNELLAAQRDAVQNAEEQKKKIKELYKEGYDKLISSIQKLIDEYKEASNAAKELHDYQESIADKTSAVNKIQKQILAYSNGDTEENRATLQKLNEDLKKAQKDLANTEREKEKKDQEQLLDKFLRDLQEYADEQLLDVDKLLKESIKTTNNNKEAITKTISNKVNDLELSTSTNFETLWEKFSSTGLILTSTKDTVNKIREKANKLPTQDWQKGELEKLFGNDSNFIRKLGSIKNNTIRTKDKITETKKAINNVKSKVVEFKKKNKEQLKEIDDGIDDVEKIEAKVEEYTGKEIPGKIDSVVDAIESKDLSVVVNVDAGGGYDVDPGGGDNPGGDNPGGGDNPPKPENKKYYHITNTDYKYDTAEEASRKASLLASNEASERLKSLPGYNKLPTSEKNKIYRNYLQEAQSKYQVKYYKRGGLIGDDSSFLDAIAQLLGEDHMIAAREGERVLTEKQNKNFEKMVNANFTPLGSNPLAIDKLISDMAQVSTPNVGTINNVGNTTTVGDVNITLPNVTNKQEFVSWLKNDGQIEKIIQSMTVGRIAGGNSFAKMKY